MAVILPQAGGLASMGMSATPRGRWRMTNSDWAFMGPSDSLYVEVEAQRSTDQVEVTDSTDSNQVGGFGDLKKGSLPGSSAPRIVNVSGEWVARDAADDITPVEAKFQRLRTQDPALGRAPLVLFEWGKFTLEGYITALSIVWVDGLAITGNPMRFQYRFTLEEFVDRPLDTTRQGTERSTYHHTMRGSETFEHLAQQYLGDPRKSAQIAQTNPGVEEVEQVQVAVLPKAHSQMVGAPAPRTPFLAAGDFDDLVDRAGEARL